jgi:predicted ester cyclase
MTREAIEQILARHQEGFLRRDAEALAATHTRNGTFESPAHGVLTGRPAIRDMYRYWYAAFPDFMLRWESPLIDPPHASFFWSFKGTSAGPFFGDVRAGTLIDMTGAAQYTLSDEGSDQGIVAARHVFDFSGVLVRAGVLKIKPA